MIESNVGVAKMTLVLLPLDVATLTLPIKLRNTNYVLSTSICVKIHGNTGK